MTTNDIALVLAGLAIGLGAGEAYLLILHRSVRALVEQRARASMLRSAPLRISIPVLALTLAAAWDHLALLGASAGLLVTQITAQLSERARNV